MRASAHPSPTTAHVHPSAMNPWRSMSGTSSDRISTAEGQSYYVTVIKSSLAVTLLAVERKDLVVTIGARCFN
jgi:hypothetical protein